MRITYDNSVNASYIYFTPIDLGGVAKTIAYQKLIVGLDEADQIAELKLDESEECIFSDRLKYALQHPNVIYDEVARCLTIALVSNHKVKRSISWESHIDLDQEGQILGLEIIFSNSDSKPGDKIERLCADGKLRHVAKYIVPFDARL